MKLSGLHDRRFSGHFQLPTLNSEKLCSPSANGHVYEKQPSSPFKKALQSPWAPNQRGDWSNVTKQLTASNVVHYIVRFLYLLVPSFISSRFSRDSGRTEKLHPTAYLDGMRGLAAFVVFLCHLSYGTWFITFGFGQGNPGENTYLIQLPIVRLFYSGPPMVSIFFVISGYALSYRPVRQMRAKQYDGLLATMSSSVVRRPIRLFLPCFVSTFLVACMAQMGIYEQTAWFAHNMRAIYEDHPWTAPDVYTQFWDWMYRMFDFVHCFNFFIFAGSPEYDRHLWTIPCEFRASMVLFLTHFMVARMQTTIRLATLLGLIWWGMQWDRWELCLFWAGCILAELDQVRSARENADSLSNQHPAVTKQSKRSKRLWNWFWIFSFVSGLYLASYPDTLGEDTPGYRTLATMIPWYYSEKYRFWQCFAAVQIVWTVNHADFLKRPFTSPFVIYLGKISYAIYLMHGPVIHTFGYTVCITLHHEFDPMLT
ncbi:MAG: hypothetical protein Q9162_002215 [Coniocarpon cinnabarinum]